MSPCRCRWIAAFPGALRWTDIQYGVARLIDLVPPEDHGAEEQPNRGVQSDCSSQILRRRGESELKAKFDLS